jgi:predicted AlkP superfamily phosphohydrolase/phosphomutase
MNSTRVFVIGLDAGTFDLLDPWIKEGRLPNLKRMIEKSTHGRLESTIPPVTPPAWTSFMTGVNPGKHGVLDFFTFDPNSFKKGLVNSSHVRSKRFWDLSGERGKRSIILYVPVTYPPRMSEGIMISGIPAPLQGEFIYPKEMGRNLEEKLGKWWIVADGDKFMDFHEETFLSEIYQTLETRFRVASYLMTKEWDLFVWVIMETDWIQHFLWEEKERCLLPFYIKIDEMIGHFKESLKKEDVILILSDHGFGSISKNFYINSWLREKGFLISKRQRVRPQENLDLGIVHHKKESSMIQKIKYLLVKKRLGIDWQKTQAYFYPTGWFWGIRINMKGREPNGIVQPEEYDEVRNRIIEAMERTVDEEEGIRVFERVYRREGIYSGAYTKNAPDIIFALHPDYYLSDRIGNYIFKKRKDRGGFHRRDGMFILHGPGIKKGEKIERAHIMDVAPTILYLLGLPVPKDFDGKVLVEALEPDVLKAYPIRTEDISLEVEGTDFVMTKTEEEEVRKSLKGLGYLG